VNEEILLAQAEHFDDACLLLEEYFEAVKVQVRDDRKLIAKYLTQESGRLWLAYVNGEAAGCIALRPLEPGFASGSGEIKRLYVRPRFRRQGIAARLLASLEAHAFTLGLTGLFLDSKDDLPEAIQFYEQSGYTRCERYNDNPQATVFLSKPLK
jgi:GNAT superfamily N-acetyltransferase